MLFDRLDRALEAGSRCSSRRMTPAERARRRLRY